MLQKHYRNHVSSISIEGKEPSNADERFLFKLNNIIIENLNNPDLDVDFIAERMGMARTTLYNRLKALNYMGINDCINNFRIEKALQMLRETIAICLKYQKQSALAVNAISVHSLKRW